MSIAKQIIEKGVYPYMEKRKGNKIRIKLKELKNNQNLPADELRLMQSNKLGKLLIHCINNVPAYGDYKQLEGEITKDALGALSKFPMLDKKTFKSGFESYIASNIDRKTLIENQTGGSTNEPVKFYMDRHMVEYYEAARWRGLSWWDITPGSPSIMIWGNPQELDKLGERKHYLKERWLKNRIIIPAYDIKPEKMKDYLKTIRHFKPEYIYGYSSALDLFSEIMLKQGLTTNIKLKAVVSTAETLHDYQRENIEKAFGCKVVNEYGARDGGIIAYQCPEGNMHISADNLILEVVDPITFEPLPQGEKGIFLVTDLNNYVMPRLRYRIGDRGALSGKTCSCHIGLPVLSVLDGREADVFVTADGKYIHGHAFNRLSRRINSISRFQLIQEKPSYARLLIVLSDNPVQEEIDEFVRSVREMLPGTQIDISNVDHIPSGGSGKYRQTIRKFSLE